MVMGRYITQYTYTAPVIRVTRFYTAVAAYTYYCVFIQYAATYVPTPLTDRPHISDRCFVFEIISYINQSASYNYLILYSYNNIVANQSNFPITNILIFFVYNTIITICLYTYFILDCCVQHKVCLQLQSWFVFIILFLGII